MADSKEAIPLEHLHQGKAHGHGHEHDNVYNVLQKPEGFVTSLRFAPCFLFANLILLALTAQVFQQTVFSVVDTNAPLNLTDCNCVSQDARCQDTFGECLSNGECFFAPLNDTSSGCIDGNDDFQCWGGQCIAVTDACYGKVCRAPADSRCVASIEGTCSNGACEYPLLADGTRCPAQVGDSGEDIVFKGWTCQQGICASPTRKSLANFAYTASIQAGIIGSALAVEIILTGDFTPDLAALAINAGLIVIGFDGRFQDIGLEQTDGIGRTQVAFGFIAGGLAVIFGAWLLSTKKHVATGRNKIIAYILIAFWLVAFGVVSNVIAEMYELFDAGLEDSAANIVYNWAYPATIFAASVNIALAHSILSTGSYTSGFAAFAAITGLIALAFTSQHQDIEGEKRNDSDYSESVLAWQSFSIIAGAISLILGFVLAFTHKPAKTDDDERQNKSVSRGFALLIVVVFFTLIGLVASLFYKHFFDRREDIYGNDARLVGGDNPTAYRTLNYGNQVSPFAWDFSIWSAAVAASFGVELLVHGGGSGGITALALTQAANLVGWAAKHANVGNVRLQFEELRGLTRAWEGVALVAGSIACLVALSILRSNGQLNQQSGQPPVVVHPHPDAARSSLNADDRDLFATDQGPRRDE